MIESITFEPPFDSNGGARKLGRITSVVADAWLAGKAVHIKVVDADPDARLDGMEPISDSEAESFQ